MVARDQGQGWGVTLFMDLGFSVWGDENVPELGRGDGGTTL